MLERIDTYLGQDLSHNESDPTKGYKNAVVIHGGSSGLAWTVFYNHENKAPLISFMYTYFECVSTNVDIATLFESQYHNYDGSLGRENGSILKLIFYQYKGQAPDSRAPHSPEVVLKFYCPRVVGKPEG
jgi:hypothetical protein